MWETDAGHVYGWGYGGEGQLGLGSRTRIVSTPQRVPCFSSLENGVTIGEASIPGSCVTRIACGGRHSAVITGTYAIMIFNSISFVIPPLE